MQQSVQSTPCQIKVVNKYRYNAADILREEPFGVVYDCTHIETKEEFALKAIPLKRKHHDLKEEIAIMLKLKGPNIVKFHQMFKTTNNIYLVMDMCDSNLEQYGINIYMRQLKEKKLFQEKEAVKIMTDILNGYLELIENGIVHRDLKPANIGMKNNVYILRGFYFAQFVDDYLNQKLDSFLGSPLYMSPQILNLSLYTTKTDIWSFEIIFYEILYGKAPWSGNSHVELLKNIKEEDLTFPDETNKVSEQVKDVIRKCLTIEEKDRISWIELFQQPLFTEKNQTFLNLEERCKRVEEYIAINLIQIAKKNLSIEYVIKVLKIEELSAANLEFLFKKIDKNIQKLEVQYIYQKIKQNHQQQMTIDDLKAWLNKFEIPIQNLYRQNLQNACLYDLKDALYKFNATLQQCFDKFNEKKDGKLTLEEFQFLCLKVNQKYSIQQIFDSFHFVDTTDKEFITEIELQQTLDRLQK